MTPDPKITDAKKRDVALVVDDSPDTLRLLTDALDGAGMTVMVALDGAGAMRIVASRRAKAELLERLGRRDGEGQGVPAFFYGSGDFHHLTSVLLSRVEEPVTVVQFDNHPD